MSDVRCFVAANLPPEVRADLGLLQGRLRSLGLVCRWVAPGTMHLTLKFFGHLPVETLAELQDVLTPPLELDDGIQLEPARIGAFPSGRRARVIWAGLDGDVGLLARAALTVEARAEKACGIPRETRPFHPHLTLGRAKNPGGIRNVERIIEREGAYRGPAFTVNELVLYESRLRPEGAEYLPRLTISL